MQLSKFFTVAEMTRSDTAAREGIPNDPDEIATRHLQALCIAVLDPLREAIQVPINVNSGYRGPQLNAHIGGAKSSQHMAGKAADIQSSGMSVLELFKAVIRLGLPFDQVIYEAKSRTSKWVHVSHDPARARGQILIAQFGADGRVNTYQPVSAQSALDLSEPRTRAMALESALSYEELPDEPELDAVTAGTTRPKAKARRKPARKKKVAAKRTTPKRKSARPKSAKRKSASRGKRARRGAKKHK